MWVIFRIVVAWKEVLPRGEQDGVVAEVVAEVGEKQQAEDDAWREILSMEQWEEGGMSVEQRGLCGKPDRERQNAKKNIKKH